jgi:N-methylhydantoinase A/oxoprolinase/acetone carboxylase beta subunit
LGKATKTPIYDGSLISFGQQVNGPAVVETTDTNIVVQPKQVLHVDALGNFELHFGS